MSFSIKHKTTTVAGKKPKPADIQRGELAINLADKALFTKDQSDKIVQLGGGSTLEISVTAPAAPKPNALWWKSDTSQLFVRYKDADSEQWVEITGTADPGLKAVEITQTAYDALVAAGTVKAQTLYLITGP